MPLNLLRLLPLPASLSTGKCKLVLFVTGFFVFDVAVILTSLLYFLDSTYK